MSAQAPSQDICGRRKRKTSNHPKKVTFAKESVASDQPKSAESIQISPECEFRELTESSGLKLPEKPIIKTTPSKTSVPESPKPSGNGSPEAGAVNPRLGFFKTFSRLFYSPSKKPNPINTKELIQIPEDLQLQPKPLEDEEYYHGFLVESKLQEMLDDKLEGTFLVRRAQTFSGLEYVLSVMSAGGISNIIINEIKERKLYWVYKHAFKSIRQLVQFYIDSGISLSVPNPHSENTPKNVLRSFTIKYPLKRFNWQINHEQIELGQVLGSGQFGEVYRGFLEISFKQGRVPVAVKMVKGDNLTSKQMYDLLREAENMKRLQHPNIVRFYGIAASKNPCMMALEFCHGGSLDDRLNRPTSEHQKVRYLYHAALGMEYLHDVDIIHGDLAVRNCFITKNDVVKIGDFGLAAGIDGGKIGEGCFPFRYMAPEAVRNMSNSKESDAWAFSVLMFEVFHRGGGPFFEYSPSGMVLDYVKKDQLHMYLFERPKVEILPEDIEVDTQIWYKSVERPQNPMITLRLGSLFDQLRFRNVKFRPKFPERTSFEHRKSIVGVLSTIMKENEIED